jgi:hypothetical protein
MRERTKNERRGSGLMRRQRERIARLLMLNAGLLGIVVVIQGIYLMRQNTNDEPVQDKISRSVGVTNRADPTTATTPTSAAKPLQEAMPSEPTEPVVDMMSNPVEGYLRSAIGPLRTAATDHGLSATGILPSDDAVAAAVATNSFDSQETRFVMADLRDAYSEFDMPFPDPVLSAPVGVGSGSGEAGNATKGDILGAFFQVTSSRLSRAVDAAGDDPKAVLPTEVEIARATRSGDLDSEASKQALTRLRAGYERYQLRFPEPSEALSGN